MITVAGVVVGIALVRFAGQQPPWLRSALLAQTADLVTFAAVWEHSQGELNPLGSLAKDLSDLIVGPSAGVAVPLAAVILTFLKLALIAYLVRAEPHLGRYRRMVLAVATAAGALGAASNVLAHPNSSGSLIVLAVFVVVAVRAPARYGDAVGVAARLTVSALLAIGGLAALSYLSFASDPFFCGSDPCAPTLATLLLTLAIMLFFLALISLWLTLRFAARFLPDRREGRSPN